MRLLFGVGNPGPEYEGTRHNLGFALIDRFASASYSPLPGFPAEAARTELAGEPLLVVRPLTYVNRCGPVLAGLLRLCGLDAARALVAVDDLDLPVGTVRLRGKGSPGGHNGLRSIEASLRTDHYPRLRLGIRGEGARAHPDYVLGRFPEEEAPRVEEALNRAVSAVRSWGARGIEAAMGEVNRRLLDPDPDRP
ncbi:MAG: aminoacyl-tRNA hydrolase [Planctomycetota bacterium]